MQSSARRTLNIAGQALLYALFALALAVFTRYPPYRPLAPDQGLLKLSFSHSAQLKSECRQRSAEELARLAPNMRTPMDCPRERSPVTVELRLDEKLVQRSVVPPSGLSRDGASTLYARYVIPAGAHRLSVRLNDSVRTPAFNHVLERAIHVDPGQVIVVDFDPRQGGIVLR